jgi:cardiolipin synthase A/B
MDGYMLNHWMTLHGLIAIAGLAVYISSSHTLHLRRHPSAAIAWVFSLILLPYLSLPLYLIFGSRKVVGLRPARREATQLVPDTLTARMQQLATVMALPCAASYRDLAIHEDGAEALRSMRSLIEQASRTLDVSTFIFARDRLGEEISARLKRKAESGVRVRLLVDGVGAYLGARTDFAELANSGIEVALFVPPLRSSLRGRTNLRNHRKMVIADGQWLWCGGRNLAAEYFEGDGAAPWVDLSFDLHGRLASQAERQFERDWRFAKGIAQRGSVEDTAQENGAGQLIVSGPDQADDTFYTLLVSGFFNAKKSILAVTPYFVPDPTLLMSLTLAARRGVAVDLLMPRKSNHRLADIARHRALRELTAAGGRVWFLPSMLHAKAVMIDGEVAFAGSANLDQRSLFLNYEMMIAFYEKNDVQRFSEWLASQMSRATPYRPRKPGIWQEIAEGMLLWLAFQL